MRRIISLVLVLVIAAMLCACGKQGSKDDNAETVQRNACGDSLTWWFDSESATLHIEGEGDMWDFAKDKDNYIVERPWGKISERIKNVSLPNGLTSIGVDAFYGCEDIVGIVIPYGVTSIGDGAFYSCSDIVTISVPDTVTSIGQSVFAGCDSLAEIRFEGTGKQWDGFGIKPSDIDGVKIITSDTPEPEPEQESKPEPVIKEELFEEPNDVRTRFVSLVSNPMPEDAEENACGESLRWFVDGEAMNILYISGEGDMWDFVSEDEDGGYSAADSPWAYYADRIESVVLDNRITGIGANAFRSFISLTAAELPDNLETIRDSAFFNCSSLKSISIPKGVEKIADGAFVYCYSLERIDVEDGNRSYVSDDGVLFTREMSALACYPAGKRDAVYAVPDGLRDISPWAFGGCGEIRSILISESVNVIGAYAFISCGAVTDISLPDELEIFGESAFAYCESLDSINIPNGITAIPNEAFRGCKSLETVFFPENLRSIGEYAFADCVSLANSRLPEGIHIIKKAAFSGCEALVSVEIPKGIASIGKSAFGGCRALESVIFDGTEEQWSALKVIPTDVSKAEVIING